MTTAYLFQPEEAVVKADWMETWALKWFLSLAKPGRLPFKGPLLIFQGDADPAVNYNTTLQTVKDTCKQQHGDLEFLTVPAAGHFPAIEAAKQTWLAWIPDRFEGRRVAKSGCGVTTELESFLPVSHYQTTPNSFPLWARKAQWMYELPTAA